MNRGVENFMGVLVVLMMYSYAALGQQNILDRKITVRIENQSVEQALQTISEETSYVFNYFYTDVPKDRVITKSYTNVRLGDILRDVWGNDLLTLRVQGNRVDLQSNPKRIKRQTKGNLAGKVIDEKGQSIPGVAIRLVGTSYGTTTDENGFYTLEGVRSGNHLVEVSFLGYDKIEQPVKVPSNSAINLNFQLTVSVSELDEIVVRGITEAQEISLQPIQVSSVDLRSVQSQAVEVGRILDDLPGVRIRQSGGFGSRTEIQLNGAVGNAVRTYLDGIPLEYMATRGSINSIPVNLIDRIDVYKGVIPIDIGTDALAGGINFVTKQVYSNLFDVSYEVGSFNTHRATLNTYVVKDSSFFIGFNGFYNYSDNNYEMNVISAVFSQDAQGNFNGTTGEVEEITVERFHDDHQSFFTELHTGLRDQPWADEISYRIAHTSTFNETQHGARVTNQPAGEADQEGSGIIQRLAYLKSGLFNNLVDVSYQGTLNFINEVTRDSTNNLYNWRGQVIDGRRGPQNRSEIAASPTARDIDQTSTSQRLNLGFNLHTDHRLMASNFYGRQHIEGKDPLFLGDDPNQVPAILEKNISGLSYESQWFNEKLIVTVFGKYYQYTSEATDLFARNASVTEVIRRSDDIAGYGSGVKWVINDDLFIRSSYEQAVRIPTANELIGNFVTSRSNPFLRPEQSDNLNLGFVYSKYFSDKSYFSVDFNSFLRYANDLIVFDASELTLGQFINEDETGARGIEVAMSGAVSRLLRGQLNITRQRIIDSSEGNPTSGQPIPNRPDFLISASVSYLPVNWFDSNRQLSFSWFTNFIEEFNFVPVGGIRRDENFVPTQFINDFGTTYQIEDKGLSFSVQVNNIFDEEVFDFISVPRPGRNFRFKIRYAINQ